MTEDPVKPTDAEAATVGTGVAFAEGTKSGSSDPNPNPNPNRSSNIHASVAIDPSKWNYGIPSRKSVKHLVAENHGEESLVSRAHHFFDRKPVQFTMIGLLILDILIIFVEIMLLAEHPSCRIIQRDCLACCPNSSDGHNNNNNNNETEEHRWLATTTSHHHGDDSFCEADYDLTGAAACDAHKWAAVHTAEEVLFWTTITILVLFLVENLIEMAALGPRRFFSQLFLAMDFAVVFLSLVLELIFHFLKSHIEQQIAILVIFRVWRFVRVGHGLLEISSEFTSKEYECLFEYVKECEDAMNQHAGIAPPEKSEKLQKLLNGHQQHHTAGE